MPMMSSVGQVVSLKLMVDHDAGLCASSPTPPPPPLFISSAAFSLAYVPAYCLRHTPPRSTLNCQHAATLTEAQLQAVCCILYTKCASFRKCILSHLSGRHKGFGFCEYSSEQEVGLAIQQLDGAQFMGRSIKV